MRHTYLWLAQLATGAVILVLIGIHVIAQHPNGILMITQRFDAVLGTLGVKASTAAALSAWSADARQDLWVGLYIAILVFALYHGANGLRGIIVELSSSGRTRQIIAWTAFGAGAVFLSALLVSRLLTAKV